MPDPQEQFLRLAEQHDVDVPSREDLKKLEDAIVRLRKGKRWQQMATMTRQPIERYLQDEGLPLSVAPILAGILAREGEPWAMVLARLTHDALEKKKPE